MNSLDQALAIRLDSLREQGLYRKLRQIDSPQGIQIDVNGRSVLNFSSNDYLGLANEPSIKEAAIAAVERYGVGSGASRLICGSLAPHQQLEETLARFKGAEAALAFSTGYAAAIGTVCAIAGKDDVVIIDKLCHACIVDAVRLSGARLRVFRHNDMGDLESILQWAANRAKPTDTATLRPSALIITESIFSMDGDCAPLRELAALKQKYGAWLMLDEAHATGLYGPHRRGLAEEVSVADTIEIQMGTLGKALGASGGYICGSRILVDYLVNRARSFIFSTAPVPGAAAAATAAIRFVRSEQGDQRRKQLWTRVAELQSALGRHDPCPSAIVPVVIGDESHAMSASSALWRDGLFIPAIRYPTVPRNTARLRITLSASHTSENVEFLASSLRNLNLAPDPSRMGTASV